MGVPAPNRSVAVSSIWVRWNSENAIGSTGSRSTWFTWSRSIVDTASSHSECIARMRRRSESKIRSVTSLLRELGPGHGGDVGHVGPAAQREGDPLDGPGEGERSHVVVDDGGERV